MANVPENKLIQGHLFVSAAAEKIFSALEERGNMLTAADKWKEKATERAIAKANEEHKAGVKDKNDNILTDWENSEGTRRNTLIKQAEVDIAVEEGYTQWEFEDNPFTFEGDFKVFMNLIRAHSIDGKSDPNKKIEFADYIRTLKNDCAVSLKKVAKKKKYYKTGTFSPLYIDDEAFIIAYSHYIVKQVKRAYSSRVNGKLTYSNETAKDLAFPRPIPPKPEPKKKEFKGLDGFNKTKEELRSEFSAYLSMNAHELPM